MSKNASNKCIFEECELHELKNFPLTQWNINVSAKIQQAFWRESPRTFYRNMKWCNLEAYRTRLVIKTVSYFVDLTSNQGLAEKDWRDGSSSAWDWGKEGLAWGIRGREKLYTWTTKQTTSKTVVKDFPCISRVPSSDCFKSIALHKKMHISQELAFLWITSQFLLKFCIILHFYDT